MKESTRVPYARTQQVKDFPPMAIHPSLTFRAIDLLVRPNSFLPSCRVDLPQSPLAAGTGPCMDGPLPEVE